jgi:hypothetical protein
MLASEFLRAVLPALAPDERIEIHAQSAIGGAIVRRFAASIEDALAWARPLRKTHNIGFGVALRTGEVGGVEHVSRSTALWADVDDAEFADGRVGALRAMESLALQPQIVVDCGPGLQAYWLLREAIDAVHEGGRATSAMRGLRTALMMTSQQELEGDVELADVLRLPATYYYDHAASPLPVYVVKFEPSSARYDLSDFETLGRACDGSEEAPSVEEWSLPAAFHAVDVPDFPTDVLPTFLREFVENEARATQTPRDMAAMQVLSVISASVAKKVMVRVRDGWEEPTPVWTVVATPPGTRKSPVFRDCTAPIAAWEKREAIRLSPIIENRQRRRRVLEAQIKKLESKAAEAVEDAKRDEMLARATDVARALDRVRVPVSPRVIADDCTPEKLAILMAEQSGHIALLSPEGGPFDMMAGRYSSQVPNLDVYVKGHAGDDIRVDRVGRKSEYVESPALTLGLMVQPAVVAGLAREPGFRGRGLVARGLYSMPPNLVGHREIRPQPMSGAVRSTYHQSVLWLLGLKPDLGPDGLARPHILELTSEACEALLTFASWLEPTMTEGEMLGGIADWAGKLAGAVARIAGLLHLAERVGHSDAWSHPIELISMERAIEIGRYLIPHALSAFALMGADAEVERAERVLKWIERSGAHTFTQREAFEGLKGQFRKVAALKPALRLLADHEYIRERPPRTAGGRGRGRPSVTFDVNPWVCSQYSQNSQNGAPDPISANIANSATGVRAETCCRRCGRAHPNLSGPCRGAHVGGLTAEARELLAKVRAGGKPAFVTANLRRIASENGMSDMDARNEHQIVQYLELLDAAFGEDV